MGLTVITIIGKKANEIMSIVGEMRARGMVQGKDFDFAFYQTTWDEMTGDTPDRAEFKFYDDKWATLFALQWAQ
jgi:hypothetical protein